MFALRPLEEHLAGLGRVILGYSGGVDSAFLAVVATRVLGPQRFLAVIGRSASYPAEQFITACDIATRFGIPLLEASTQEMSDSRYTANPVNRCYYCKTELWGVLSGVARERGYDIVIDGTNADDLQEHRPGLAAAAEQSVHSPLAELGWTKAMVREGARSLDIPIWDAPAAPCLSSRIAFGLPVTPERLSQVEQAEAYLRAVGVRGDLRVRHHGGRGRIEADPAAFYAIRSRWPDIEAFMQSLGFAAVELDPRGYRRGAMLSVLDLPA
jgi:uncharacterized protein